MLLLPAGLHAQSVSTGISRDTVRVGDPVRVLEGACCDCLGIYEGMSDHERVGILLDLLGRKVRVRIDAEAIAAA